MNITLASAKNNSSPIGFFDSGIGGISVLAEAIKQMPCENYIYYADSLNAPYGEKSKDEILALSITAVEKLISAGAKAIVVACNTATSASIHYLRQNYTLPFIGMEPALKPAIENTTDGDILVMATPLTLQEEKFRTLASRLCHADNVEVLPCPGLAQVIEETEADFELTATLLEKIFLKSKKQQYSAVVLGCTHYIFIQELIKKTCRANITIDGNLGTIRQLRHILELSKLSNGEKSNVATSVAFLSSSGPTGEAFCQRMLQKLTANSSPKTI
jgi:glutamate racemase